MAFEKSKHFSHDLWYGLSNQPGIKTQESCLYLCLHRNTHRGNRNENVKNSILHSHSIQHQHHLITELSFICFVFITFQCNEMLNSTFSLPHATPILIFLSQFTDTTVLHVSLAWSIYFAVLPYFVHMFYYIYPLLLGSKLHCWI